MSQYEVNLPAFSKAVNKPFADLYDNHDRLILLWGGRASGKSVAALRLLIYRALTEPYFKCILIRKVYESIRDSMYIALKDEIETLGLAELFDFTVSPMEIKCKNGNQFICRGLDKPEKLKSIKEPSFAWYEEGNQITEEDYITVTTSIRSNKARYLQEVFSFNPETHGENYQDFWLYKRFFSHTVERTFRSNTQIEINGKSYNQSYTSIHSTWHDNPHLPPSIIAELEALKKNNPYYYQVYALGNWGNKEVSNPFYKGFTMDLVKPVGYINTLPLHVSFDENVNPYLTCTIHQVRDWGDSIKIWQIDEICLVHPKNTLRDTCEEIKRRYRGHTEGLYIYGDRTSNKQDAKLEKGQNFYTLAAQFLKDFRPSMRIPSKNPNVKSRGEFINDVFSGRYPDVTVEIGENCTNTVQDYLNVVEAADGTKLKAKVKDKNSGITFEKFGHTSDANDYLFIEVLKSKYLSYIAGDKTLTYKAMPRAMVRKKNRL